VIGIVVVVVLVVVAVAAIWTRVASSRVERRSVEGYGKALDTLGGVAKRSEAGAPVHAPSADELARPHVRPTGGAPFRPTRPPAAPLARPGPRIRLRPPPGAGSMPVFSDLDHSAKPDHSAEPGPAAPSPAASSPAGASPAGRPSAFDEPPTLLLPVARGGRPGIDAEVDEVAPSGPLEAWGGARVPPEELLTTAVPIVRAEGAAGVGPRETTGVGPADESASSAGSLEGAAATGVHGPAPFDGAAFDDDGPVGAGASQGRGEERFDRPEQQSQRMRRAATGAAAAVALGALGVGSWQLARDSASSTQTHAVGVVTAPPRSKPAGRGVPGTSKSTASKSTASKSKRSTGSTSSGRARGSGSGTTSGSGGKATTPTT